MHSLSNMNTVLDDLIEIAKKAGDEILSVYSNSFDVTLKEDLSPLTDADRRSNAVIVSMLESYYPDTPILSEEGQKVDYNDRKKWEQFWLVDPLDGTKEFVKRNGEFTVNIALIKNGSPIAGIVYAPTTDTYWYGGESVGSFKREGNSESKKIEVCSDETDEVKIVSSRSHPSPRLAEYISRFPNHSIVGMGSSLKICLVADGTAHIYPRLGPTMEWDSGAGHAVVKYAGGMLIDVNTNQELMYNKENLLNPYFICYSKSVEGYDVN